MRFVGDDSEAFAFGGGEFPHGFQREWERLNRANDNLLIAGKCLGQFSAFAAVIAFDGGVQVGELA